MTVEDTGDDDGEGKRPGESDEQAKVRKRKERLEQNRISARESRKRKKTMIEELQRTVITLSRENKELNERNESLRRQLMDIGAKYPNIVPLQAIVQQGTAQGGIDGAAATTAAVASTTTAAAAPAAATTTSSGDAGSVGGGAGTNDSVGGGGGDTSVGGGDASAASAAGGVGSSLNPMNWLGGGGGGTAGGAGAASTGDGA